MWDTANFKKCEYFMTLLTYIFVVTILIMSAVERANLNSKLSQEEIPFLSRSADAVLSDIAVNPIKSIEVLNTNGTTNCSAELVTIFKWETVWKYCNCGDNVTRLYCPRRSPCKNRTRVTYSMPNWRGKQFCVTRLQPGQWKFSTKKGGSCSEDFRLCPGDICVSKSISECPVTDLLISSKLPASLGVSYTNISYFADSRSVFISRDKQRSVLNTITAGIPDTPCIEATNGPSRTKLDIYPIIELVPNGCNFTRKYGADNNIHNPLDISKEWTFYEENVNLEYFLSLPNYRNFVGDEKITLYSKNKIEFKEDKIYCGGFDFGSLKSVSSDVNSLEELRMGANLPLLIVTPMVIVFMTVLFIIEVCSKDGGILFQMLVFFVIMASFLSFCLIIINGIANNYIGNVDTSSVILKELAETQCFKVDSYNKIFEEYKTETLSSFEIGRAFNAAGLGVSITYFIISFVFFVLKLFVRWYDNKIRYLL